jgi:hypothetical protein
MAERFQACAVQWRSSVMVTAEQHRFPPDLVFASLPAAKGVPIKNADQPHQVVLAGHDPLGRGRPSSRLSGVEASSIRARTQLGKQAAIVPADPNRGPRAWHTIRTSLQPEVSLSGEVAGQEVWPVATQPLGVASNYAIGQELVRPALLKALLEIRHRRPVAVRDCPGGVASDPPLKGADPYGEVTRLSAAERELDQEFTQSQAVRFGIHRPGDLWMRSGAGRQLSESPDPGSPMKLAKQRPIIEPDAESHPAAVLAASLAADCERGFTFNEACKEAS